MASRVITKKAWVKPNVKLITAGSAEAATTNVRSDGTQPNQRS
jgi:hypothetical protein